VCRRCTFDGRLIAPHVVFERGIDLSGSTVNRPVTLEGARFKEAALFGPAGGSDDDNTVFRGPVDLSFATFDDLAVLRRASFERKADFTSARFGSFARFGEATFAGDALFEEAIFARDASFAHGGFSFESRFKGAVFGGVVDFRQANFAGATTFFEAVFRERAEFSRASMAAQATFDDARFATDALFTGTQFLFEANPALTFDHAGIHDRLDLDGARLEGSAEFLDASVQVLSLDGVDYGSSSNLYVNGLATTDASLDLHDVPHIRGDVRQQQKILETAEETAKSAGELGLANDLHYRLQVLASEDDRWLRHIADIALYRAVAGYFVRPFRPLLWLLGLVFVAAFVRTLPPSRPPEAKKEQKPQRAPVVRVGRRFADKLIYTVSPHARAEEEAASFRRVELTAYAVLVGCFLLALANTNPTLRDMVDTLV